MLPSRAAVHKKNQAFESIETHIGYPRPYWVKYPGFLYQIADKEVFPRKPEQIDAWEDSSNLYRALRQPWTGPPGFNAGNTISTPKG
jgi:hypothetical protein